MADTAGQLAALRRDRHKATDSVWRAAGWMPLWALLVGLMGLIYLIATSSVLSIGYDVQRLERERAEWRSRNDQLQLELAKVRSLAWIEAQATTRLGMAKPERVTYIELEHVPVLATEQPPVAARSDPPPTRDSDPWRLAAERVGALLPRQP